MHYRCSAWFGSISAHMVRYSCMAKKKPLPGICRTAIIGRPRVARMGLLHSERSTPPDAADCVWSRVRQTSNGFCSNVKTIPDAKPALNTWARCLRTVLAGCMRSCPAAGRRGGRKYAKLPKRQVEYGMEPSADGTKPFHRAKTPSCATVALRQCHAPLNWAWDVVCSRTVITLNGQPTKVHATAGVLAHRSSRHSTN